MNKRSACEETQHSDHSRELSKLKKLKGQIEGVEKMINQRRYCADILGQVRAVRVGLLGVEASILETHLKSCVAETIKTGDISAAEEKIEEIIQLFRQSSSKGVRL